MLAKNNSSISKRGGCSNSSHNANFSHYMIMIISMNVRGISCLNLIFFTGSYINLGSTKNHSKISSLCIDIFLSDNNSDISISSICASKR